MSRRRHLAAAAATALAFAACGERAPRIRFDPGPVPAEHTAGSRLFDARCSGCHGLLAGGTDSGPPLVHGYYAPNHHADEAFQRAVALGVPAHHWRFGSMPPVPGVSRAEVERITAYVRWLQRAAGVY